MANKAIVATKVGMTQLWNDDNKVVPVTMLRVEPCRIVQVKTPERDGYSALQVTWGTKPAHRVTRPEAGHFAKADVEPGRRLVELRLGDVSDYEVGQQLSVDLLEEGELVDVTAVSKGKGFAGVMKRHNFAGQKASHGTHLRPPGTRLHRRLRHAGPRVQGHPDGRPPRRPAGSPRSTSRWSGPTPSSRPAARRDRCPGPRAGSS